MIHSLARQIVAGRTSRVITVILAPVVQLPVELEKLFVVLPHPLPASQELLEIARGVATEPGELPEESDLQKLLDASAGLTRMEAENAFSLSLVRSGKITPETVWEMKSQMLKKSGLVTLYRGQDDFRAWAGWPRSRHFANRPSGFSLRLTLRGWHVAYFCSHHPDVASRSSARPWAGKLVGRYCIWMLVA